MLVYQSPPPPPPPPPHPSKPGVFEFTLPHFLLRRTYLHRIIDVFLHGFAQQPEDAQLPPLRTHADARISLTMLTVNRMAVLVLTVLTLHCASARYGNDNSARANVSQQNGHHDPRGRIPADRSDSSTKLRSERNQRLRPAHKRSFLRGNRSLPHSTRGHTHELSLDAVEMRDATPNLTWSDLSHARDELPTSSWITRLRHIGDQGNHVPAPDLIGNGCRQFNWTETTAVQALLYRHQNPHNCSSAKFLVYHPRRSGGLASLLEQLKNALTVGLMLQRVVVFYDAHGWPLVEKLDCGSKTFDCLLMPLSRCRVTGEEMDSTQKGSLLSWSTIQSLSTSNQRIIHADTGANSFSRHVPAPFVHKDRFWWFAQAILYCFRLRPSTFNAIRQFAVQHQWGARQATVALHLRSEDRGKNYIGPLLEYVRQDPSMSTADRVFVATDDPEAVETLRNVVASDQRTGGLFSNAVFDAEQDRRKHVVVDILREPSKVNATQLTFESIKNMALLASGQYFVGTIDSGFSKVSAALGCAAGYVRQEPLVFGHWAKDQDPTHPPISSMGTGYYVGPSLHLGERPPGDFNAFNTSDMTMHPLGNRRRLQFRRSTHQPAKSSGRDQFRQLRT